MGTDHARRLALHSVLIAAAPVVLGACASKAPAPVAAPAAPQVLQGEVVYHEKVLLPGDAVTWVTLRQTTPDGETTIASARVDSCIQSPLPFQMTIPADAYDPYADHCLLTEIRVDGERQFAGSEDIEASEDLNGGKVRIVARLMP